MVLQFQTNVVDSLFQYSDNNLCTPVVSHVHFRLMTIDECELVLIDITPIGKSTNISPYGQKKQVYLIQCSV
jgi:hypothetical protein